MVTLLTETAGQVVFRVIVRKVVSSEMNGCKESCLLVTDLVEKGHILAGIKT